VLGGVFLIEEEAAERRDRDQEAEALAPLDDRSRFTLVLAYAR
jgi:hypothetical protein